MRDKDIYLTFKTDRETSYMLSYIAHAMNKTQPELIDEICKDFIELITSEAEKRIKEIESTTNE